MTYSAEKTLPGLIKNSSYHSATVGIPTSGLPHSLTPSKTRPLNPLGDWAFISVSFMEESVHIIRLLITASIRQPLSDILPESVSVPIKYILNKHRSAVFASTFPFQLSRLVYSLTRGSSTTTNRGVRIFYSFFPSTSTRRNGDRLLFQLWGTQIGGCTRVLLLVLQDASET